MALVDYSNSESEGEQESEDVLPPSKKRRTSSPPEHVQQDVKKRNVREDESKSSMPPLPAAFLDMYSSTVKKSASDDPSMHQGRKRTIPHVQGNWPTHIFLDCRSNNTGPFLQLISHLSSLSKPTTSILISQKGTPPSKIQTSSQTSSTNKSNSKNPAPPKTLQTPPHKTPPTSLPPSQSIAS